MPPQTIDAERAQSIALQHPVAAREVSEQIERRHCAMAPHRRP